MSKYCIDSRDFRDELTQLLTTTAHDDDTEYTRQRFQEDTARAILLMFQSILKMITDTNEEVQASRKQYERIVSEIRILETMFQTHLQSVPSTQQTAPDPPHFNTYLKVGVFDGIPFKICLVHDIDEKSVLPFKAVVFRRSPGASFQRLCILWMLRTFRACMCTSKHEGLLQECIPASVHTVHRQLLPTCTKSCTNTAEKGVNEYRICNA